MLPKSTQMRGLVLQSVSAARMPLMVGQKCRRLVVVRGSGSGIGLSGGLDGFGGGGMRSGGSPKPLPSREDTLNVLASTRAPFDVAALDYLARLIFILILTSLFALCAVIVFGALRSPAAVKELSSSPIGFFCAAVGTVLTSIGIVLTMASGFKGEMKTDLARLDDKIDKLDSKFDNKIDKLESKFDNKFDRMDEKMDRVLAKLYS